MADKENPTVESFSHTAVADTNMNDDNEVKSSQEEVEDDAESISTQDTVNQKKVTKTEKLNLSKMVQWTGCNKRQAVMVFRADGLTKPTPEHRHLGEKYHMSFKMFKTECKLVRNTLSSHGFHEAHPSSNEFSLLWTGSHLRPYVLRALSEFQKVNHFPRSYEITRKDRLYRNVQRMQQLKGFKHFDFVPLSFICPAEFQDFCTAYLRDKGTWIVKPIASSRGRGIFLINHPDQLPLDETYIVSRYVPKPLLVDGFKFDLRLYVAVTSYDPLVIYLYEEGLCRFATIRYESQVARTGQNPNGGHVSSKNIKNHCMHLTNYSVNKKSGDFVQNEDADVEDYGNKWSLGAALRCLRVEGHDTTAVMLRIEDAIIKTLISVEMPIATATKMFMPHRGNCFELYGFDILLDSNLRPWVLEVNLSPSLACDSPIDLKIKSNMVSDMFSLTGFILHDPMLRTQAQSKRNGQVTGKDPIRQQKSRPGSASSMSSLRSSSQRSSSQASNLKLRPSSGRLRAATATSTSRSGSGDLAPLSQEEAKIVRKVKEEFARRGGFVRIFPTPESWDLYSNFLSFPSGHNQMLHQRLFPDRYTNYNQINRPGVQPLINKLRLNIHCMPSHGFVSNGCPEMERFLTNGLQRTMLYERKLGAKIKPHKMTSKSALPPTKKSTNQKTAKPEPGPPSDESYTASEREEESETHVPAVLQGEIITEPVPQIKQVVNEHVRSADEHAKPIPPLTQYNQRRDTRPVAKVEPLPQHNPPPPELSTEQANNRQTEIQAEPFDLVAHLKKGCILTRAQARFAFATYLTRVQCRLMSETGDVGSEPSECEDLELVNEQMDLVLRFLKRAAVNLSQPFKVVVPTRRLPVNDRRRILSKQLGDFVHIYSKETDQIMKHNKKELTSITSQLRINQYQLEQFVTNAEETELEQVLTTYTKINKSAAIFLGSSGRSTDDKSSSQRGHSALHHRPSKTAVDNLHGVIVNGNEGTGGWQDELTHKGATSNSSTQDHNTVYSRNPSYSANQKSSFQNAMYVYSGKTLGASSIRSRPSSASSSRGNVGSSSSQRNLRPSSASLTSRKQDQTDTSIGDYSDGVEDVNSTLQRLNMKQQERNYSRTNVASRTTQPHQRTQSAHTTSTQQPNTTPAPQRLHTAKQHTNYDSDSEPPIQDPKKPIRNRHNRTTSADETFKDFVGSDKMTAAYSERVNMEQKFRLNPEQSRKEQQDKQTLLMQQSKALLESSKAKHQAMVAQAHAATKRFVDQSGEPANAEPEAGTYKIPHPPTCSKQDQEKTTDKPQSAAPRHRTQHRYPEAALRKTLSSDDLSTDFYRNVIYDTATGQAKLINS